MPDARLPSCVSLKEKVTEFAVGLIINFLVVKVNWYIDKFFVVKANWYIHLINRKLRCYLTVKDLCDIKNEIPGLTSCD